MHLLAEKVEKNAFCYFDKLIIVGSGSVALNIYKIAMVLGYRITVVDNRTETLTEARFPGADKLLLGDIVENLSSCDIDENTSIVIATHHHKFDEPALKAVIHSPARYIGILSNRRKAASYFDNLRAQGIAFNCQVEKGGFTWKALAKGNVRGMRRVCNGWKRCACRWPDIVQGVR